MTRIGGRRARTGTRGVTGVTSSSALLSSRERGSGGSSRRDDSGNTTGRMTPTGRMVPALRSQTPGGTRLQTRDGRSIQTSMLVCRSFAFAPLADIHAQSLIDLAGSEKATSDKELAREGKYINTRLAPWSLNAHEPSLTLTASTRPVVKFIHIGKCDFHLGRELRQWQKVIPPGRICSCTLADKDSHQ